MEGGDEATARVGEQNATAVWVEKKLLGMTDRSIRQIRQCAEMGEEEEAFVPLFGRNCPPGGQESREEELVSLVIFAGDLCDRIRREGCRAIKVLKSKNRELRRDMRYLRAELEGGDGRYMRRRTSEDPDEHFMELLTSLEELNDRRLQQIEEQGATISGLRKDINRLEDRVSDLRLRLPSGSSTPIPRPRRVPRRTRTTERGIICGDEETDRVVVLD